MSDDITLTPAELQLDSMPLTNVGSPVTLAGIQRWRDAINTEWASLQGSIPIIMDPKSIRDMVEYYGPGIVFIPSVTATRAFSLHRLIGLNSRALRLLHSKGMRVSKRNYRQACQRCG